VINLDEQIKEISYTKEVKMYNNTHYVNIPIAIVKRMGIKPNSIITVTIKKEDIQ
jgi:hypothetical protein